PGTPVVDTDGNVTWHPQKVLVTSSDGGGDGYYYYQNHFTLFWNGTLLLPGNYDSNGNPYFVQLSNDEICKILNTANASGFFEEPNYYVFRFQGASGSGITINGWKSNSSAAELLDWGISGAPYYNPLFCSDCSIPTEKTIIQPGLANMYYFLKNYHPSNPQKVPVKEIILDVNPEHSENEAITEWPLKSISLDQFMQLVKECNENSACSEKGMKFSGAIAQEIMEKIGNSQVFKSDFLGAPLIFSIDYRPQAPDLPADATLTCNTKTEPYAILPLNKDNKFWYYAPGGRWGAEVVAGQNKIRVVNTSGYEKFYGYDPAFFGQTSIQFYPRYWSEDGQFFYVNILRGDYTPNTSLDNSIGLEQIDVKNEKIKYLFLGKQGQKFAYQLSKDGKKLAYIRQGDNPLKLVVMDIASGEEHAVSLTMPDGSLYTSAGTLIWSSKGGKIYMTTTYEENGQPKTNILVAGTDNLALRILYKADKLMKLRASYTSFQAAEICDMQAVADDICKNYLDAETDEVK
ncbi:MAG: hypothetical protein WA821_15110, partial [Anaerolineales bacterium]